uniref:Putative secreted protein n=1 Tax=Anopheles darlingi TaxID=43151 RepID=A0A2M4DS46_ANODA
MSLLTRPLLHLLLFLLLLTLLHPALFLEPFLPPLTSTHQPSFLLSSFLLLLSTPRSLLTSFFSFFFSSVPRDSDPFDPRIALLAEVAEKMLVESRCTANLLQNVLPSLPPAAEQCATIFCLFSVSQTLQIIFGSQARRRSASASIVRGCRRRPLPSRISEPIRCVCASFFHGGLSPRINTKSHSSSIPCCTPPSSSLCLAPNRLDLVTLTTEKLFQVFHRCLTFSKTAHLL